MSIVVASPYVALSGFYNKVHCKMKVIEPYHEAIKEFNGYGLTSFKYYLDPLG
jgi:hypothetical protein